MNPSKKCIGMRISRLVSCQIDYIIYACIIFIYHLSLLFRFVFISSQKAVSYPLHRFFLHAFLLVFLRSWTFINHLWYDRIFDISILSLYDPFPQNFSLFNIHQSMRFKNRVPFIADWQKFVFFFLVQCTLVHLFRSNLESLMVWCRWDGVSDISTERYLMTDAG